MDLPMSEDMRIESLRAMEDNWIHLAVIGKSVAVVDPGEAGGILRLLERERLNLELILVTHPHGDHTGGCARLQSETGCRIVDTEAVADGGSVVFEDRVFRVISTPGHTHSDVCYYESRSGILFTGDTLFLCGCGRVFSGMSELMWESLRCLRGMPDDTRVYCGHDYTCENLEFALSVEPGNECLAARAERERQSPAVWSFMKEERETNPFLRPDSREIRELLKMTDSANADVFARLRAMKSAG